MKDSYKEAILRFRKKGKVLKSDHRNIAIPPITIKAVVHCPDCGEPFPVRLRLLRMQWAVDYPMKREKRVAS